MAQKEEKSSRKSPEKRALKRRDGNGGCDNQCSWPGTSSSTREGTKRGGKGKERKEGRKEGKVSPSPHPLPTHHFGSLNSLIPPLPPMSLAATKYGSGQGECSFCSVVFPKAHTHTHTQLSPYQLTDPFLQY